MIIESAIVVVLLIVFVMVLVPLSIKSVGAGRQDKSTDSQLHQLRKSIGESEV
jgi:hypothetical protein|tara:strand:+ start:1899 stop:2057 length:159 start_codon:yes stop_codon:yes gene_type:complete